MSAERRFYSYIIPVNIGDVIKLSVGCDQFATNTEWQRALSVSYNNLGHGRYVQGDLAGALSAYQQSLQIREKLATLDPANTEWQHDLSVSYDNLGDVQRAQGDLAGALSAYQQSLQIAEKLAALDPANTQWQTDLGGSLYRIARVFEQQNPPRKKDAAANYQRMLNILRPLAAANRLAADQIGWITTVEERLERLKD